MMRPVIPTLVALMVAFILGGIAHLKLDAHRAQTDRVKAQSEVRRFQQQINLRAALDSADSGDLRAPLEIDASWFAELPRNPLLPPGHPWLEIADEFDWRREHPPNLTASDTAVASFWYNPALGIIRARVPMSISDAETLAMYNEVNDCALPTLYPGR